jgi:ribosomal protein S12 methylthiotransferase accessory factor
MYQLEYPLAFGHWHLQDDRLTCRMPRKEVEVSAPRELLDSVARLCDGRLHWRAVAAQLATRWDAPRVDQFLAGLAHEGALVEASESLARWTDIGQLPALHARIASPDEIPELPQVAHDRLLPGAGDLAEIPAAGAALSDLLRRRQTFRTFADTPLSVQTLGAILWAAHGVARPAQSGRVRWHRTVSSGGNMHSARWFVIVLRELPRGGGAEAAAPGLYEAHFHREGGTSLERLESSATEAWRVLSEPRVLTFASALVLPVYDISVPSRKYGNRGTFFASIEAGQSLQNAQLMATAMGAAACVRGDTASAAVMEVLALTLRAGERRQSEFVVMPGLLLGATPDAREQALQSRDGWLQMGRGSEAGGFAFCAGPVQEGARQIFTSGRSADPRIAVVKAEAEAWERRGWATLGPVSPGTLKDVPGAHDPALVIAYTPEQYATADFAFTRFSTRRKYLWCDGVDVHSGAAVALPAECVYALSALPVRYQGAACTNTSTSGVAAWTDPEGALCRGTLELIERDAFLRRWLTRRRFASVHPATLPAAQRQRVVALESAGYRVAVADLGERFVPVYSVFVQSRGRPFTAVTAAADFDAESALAKALDEAEGRAGHATRSPAVPIASARDVRSTTDINRYYQSPRFFRHSDFYAAGPATERFAPGGDGYCSDWGALKARLCELRLRLLGFDLTPDGAAIQQGRTPLHVMRAFVPGLLPIWFQYGLQPAAAIPSNGRRFSDSEFIHPFT